VRQPVPGLAAVGRLVGLRAANGRGAVLAARLHKKAAVETNTAGNVGFAPCSRSGWSGKRCPGGRARCPADSETVNRCPLQQTTCKDSSDEARTATERFRSNKQYELQQLELTGQGTAAESGTDAAQRQTTRSQSSTETDRRDHSRPQAKAQTFWITCQAGAAAWAAATSAARQKRHTARWF
jgi:hypothetical protein